MLWYGMYIRVTSKEREGWNEDMYAKAKAKAKSCCFGTKPRAPP
jgi:hypothetical protein